MCCPHKLLQQLNGKNNILFRPLLHLNDSKGVVTTVASCVLSYAPHFDMFMSITLLQIVLLGLEGLYILCMDGCGN